MDSKYSTIHQHEPLRTPSEWGTPGKRYTAQLEELFDDLYSRLNRLKLTDLSKSLSTIITESADGMQSNRTAIEQTNEQIKLLASQESLNELSGRVETNEASITVMAGQIASKVSRTELDELGAVVDSQATAIEQTNEQIKLLASQESLNELSGRVDSTESSLTMTAKSLTTKIEAVDGRVSTVEQTVNGLESVVAGLETVSYRIDTGGYGAFVYDADTEAFLPTTMTVNAYTKTGNEAEAAYSGRFKLLLNLADGTTRTIQWSDDAATRSFNLTTLFAYFATSDLLSVGIELYAAGGFTQKLAGVTLNIARNGTSGEGGSQTFAQAAAPTSGMAEGDLWFDTDGYNAMYRYESGAWVKHQDTHLDATVANHESRITQNANAINLKVSAGDIASSINQTAQSVLIDASKINLSGYVTISSLGAGGTTTIDGSRITTGTVAAARIDVDNLYVKHLNGADGTFTGKVTAGYWTFDSNGSVYYDPSTNRQVRMDVSDYIARYSTVNMAAKYGSTSYNACYIYGGAVTLDCSSTGQSISARNGYWGSYNYNDVCFVCDQAGSSYSTAAGNLGTTDNRWDILWVDTVHYNTRDTSSSREAKHDIAPLPDFGAVLDQLQPISYRYIDDRSQRTRYGLIYEDTIGLMPDICHETTEGENTFKGISYEDLITVLLKEVQTLRKRVANLEAADNT